MGYVVAGVGVLTLGGGVISGMGAKKQESDARDKCQQRPITGFTCPESSRSDFEKAQDQARLATVLMIAGGAVTAGGLVMIIWGGPKATEQTGSLQLSPLLGPRDAGLFATGRF